MLKVDNTTAQHGDNRQAEDREGIAEKEAPAFESLLRAVAAAPSVRPVDLDLVGRKVGRFVVEKRLGQGGMGVVYEATDPVLGRRVALKVMRAAHRRSTATRERLHEEARRIASLTHPNIAAVYDVGEHDGIVYLALERASGRSLRQRLTEQPPLTLPRSIAILKSVAAALACAHDAGIVHRDLKPENVVTGEDGSVKIVDFGIAASPGADPSAVGTRRYMAPEQLGGAAASERADVYAFGVLARELLASTFVRRADQRVRAALLRFADICASKSPDARPGDGAALVSALENLLAPSARVPMAKAAFVAAGAAALAVAAFRVGPASPSEPSSEKPGARAPAFKSTSAPNHFTTPRSTGAATAPNAAPESSVRTHAAGAERSRTPSEQQAAARGSVLTGGVPLTGGSFGTAGEIAAPGDQPVTAFVDADGHLVTSVNLDAYGVTPRAGSSAGVPATGAVSTAGSRLRVVPDGNGGLVVEVTVRVQPPTPDQSRAQGSSRGKGAPGSGKLLAPAGAPGGVSVILRDIGGSGSGHDLWSQHATPQNGAVGSGSTSRPTDGSVKQVLFCVKGAPSITARLSADGTMEFTETGDEEEEVLAALSSDGSVLTLAEGAERCEPGHDLTVGHGG
ncbi:MAG: protein kinase [Polyangiaceae bacterium]|nr:protein kinase [Polyangiaceae bacterium]